MYVAVRAALAALLLLWPTSSFAKTCPGPANLVLLNLTGSPITVGAVHRVIYGGKVYASTLFVQRLEHQQFSDPKLISLFANDPPKLPGFGGDGYDYWAVVFSDIEGKRVFISGGDPSNTSFSAGLDNTIKTAATEETKAIVASSLKASAAYINPLVGLGVDLLTRLTFGTPNMPQDATQGFAKGNLSCDQLGQTVVMQIGSDSTYKVRLAWRKGTNVNSKYKYKPYDNWYYVKDILTQVPFETPYFIDESIKIDEVKKTVDDLIAKKEAKKEDKKDEKKDGK